MREAAAEIETHGGTEAAASPDPDPQDVSTHTQTGTGEEAAAAEQRCLCNPGLLCTATLTADGHTARSVAVAGLTAQMYLTMPMHLSIGYATPISSVRALASAADARLSMLALINPSLLADACLVSMDSLDAPPLYCVCICPFLHCLLPSMLLSYLHDNA